MELLQKNVLVAVVVVGTFSSYKRIFRMKFHKKKEEKRENNVKLEWKRSEREKNEQNRMRRGHEHHITKKKSEKIRKIFFVFFFIFG